MAVFKGFAELDVFVDGDFVHFRQLDEKDSWVVIPRYMWSMVEADVYRQISEAIAQEATE